MLRRELSMALLASTAGSALLDRTANAHSCTPPCYPQTAAEATAGITPTNTAIPSHTATGEIYPQRYGAMFNNSANDTTAINNAFLVGLAAGCQIVLPAGIALVSNLLFGTNSTTGASNHPPGMRGQGISTVLKMMSGASGTVLAAQGCAGVFFRDFLIDGGGVASVCIDTSWPATVGTTANNVYDNVWLQNFTQNGWLAINDNQTKFKDIFARGAASHALSGLRIEGSGGSIFLDNAQASDSFLSVTCQTAEIHGGFFFGVRVNESQNGLNCLSFSGGTQIYANPTTLSHFEDANYNLAGHYVVAIVADGLYLLASPGSSSTYTINCGIAGKVDFRGCSFVSNSCGTWDLYGPHAFNSISPAPSIIQIDGGSTGPMAFNTPNGFITRLIDVSSSQTGFTGLYSDYPMRAVYRNSYTFASGLAHATWTNVVPASAMTESGGYLLVIEVNNPGTDTLSATAFVNSVTKNGSIRASGSIAIGTSANFANNLINQIAARYSATTLINGAWYAGVDLRLNESLNGSSTIKVILIRIADPAVNY